MPVVKHVVQPATTAPHLRTGARGEETAKHWLEAKGYRTVDMNFRRKAGEIDLVMRDGETLVFVEVKTRSAGLNTRFGTPGEAVTASKPAKLLRAAGQYLMKFGNRPPACRFDVVEVDGATGDVRHLKDAFRPGW